jgi:hypothetical protein
MDSTRLPESLETGVFLAAAQRRDVHRQNVQAMVQILAESALFERRAQIGVGGLSIRMPYFPGCSADVLIS